MLWKPKICFHVHKRPPHVSVLIVINPVHGITTHFKINFLGMFAKLRKATINFVMPVCPSVCMEKLAPTGRIFMKFDIPLFFKNLLRKCKFH